MKNILFWLARLLAAVIMLQTLYFKFTAAPESVEIFTKLGMEPWGRIGVGVMELAASILIIIPTTVWLGSLLGAGLMAGAISFHLIILGIEVRGDGGYLFFLALAVFLCCLFSFWQSRKQIPEPIGRYLPSFLK